MLWGILLLIWAAMVFCLYKNEKKKNKVFIIILIALFIAFSAVMYFIIFGTSPAGSSDRSTGVIYYNGVIVGGYDSSELSTRIILPMVFGALGLLLAFGGAKLFFIDKKKAISIITILLCFFVFVFLIFFFLW